MPTVGAFHRLSLLFSGSKSRKWRYIDKYELRVFALLVEIPRFTTPRTFWRNRLKIEIYTDAFDRSPFEEDSINWESVIDIGGILAISGEDDESPSLEINEIPHQLKEIKTPRD